MQPKRTDTVYVDMYASMKLSDLVDVLPDFCKMCFREFRMFFR